MLQILITFQYETFEECQADCHGDGKYCYWAITGDGDRIFIGCCPECFPASATVFLENGKSVTMSELQTGDAVKSG